jgi:lysophospholipase L1-like esterase
LIMSWTTWIIVGVLAFGAVLLLEFAARWSIRRSRKYYVWTPRLRQRMELDTETHPQLDRVVNFEINSVGQRASEPPKRNTPAFRILVIGGSSAECYLLDQPKAWPAVLERYLSERDRLVALGVNHVHVANIAKSAMRSASVRMIAERVLPGHDRVDVIVLFMGASDVIQWLSRDADPGSIREPVRVEDVFSYHPEGPFSLSPRRSALREVARRLRDRVRQAPETRIRAGRWLGRARAMRAKATDFRDTAPDTTPLTQAFAENLDVVIRYALMKADNVIVVRQPWFDNPSPSAGEAALFWNGGVGNPQTDAITTYYSDRVLTTLLSAIDQTTVQVAKRHGLRAVNLRGDLRSDMTNYYDQFHFTNEGARVVAERIGDAIMTAHIAGSSKNV